MKKLLNQNGKEVYNPENFSEALELMKLGYAVRKDCMNTLNPEALPALASLRKKASRFECDVLDGADSEVIEQAKNAVFTQLKTVFKIFGISAKCQSEDVTALVACCGRIAKVDGMREFVPASDTTFNKNVGTFLYDRAHSVTHVDAEDADAKKKAKADAKKAQKKAEREAQKKADAEKKAEAEIQQMKDSAEQTTNAQNASAERKAKADAEHAAQRKAKREAQKAKKAQTTAA